MRCKINKGQIQQQGVISNLHRSITYFDSPPLSFLKSISSLVFVHFHLTNSGHPAKKNQLKTSIEPFFKCFRACFVVYLLCIQNVSSWFLLTAECPKAYNLHFPSLNTAFLTYIPETRKDFYVFWNFPDFYEPAINNVKWGIFQQFCTYSPYFRLRTLNQRQVNDIVIDIT